MDGFHGGTEQWFLETFAKVDASRNVTCLMGPNFKGASRQAANVRRTREKDAELTESLRKLYPSSSLSYTIDSSLFEYQHVETSKVIHPFLLLNHTDLSNPAERPTGQTMMSLVSTLSLKVSQTWRTCIAS